MIELLKKFVRLCRNTVADYVNEHTDGAHITKGDVTITCVHFYSQNTKVMATTTLSDDMYYELSFNGDDKQFNVSAYKKSDNVSVEASADDIGYLSWLIEQG